MTREIHHEDRAAFTLARDRLGWSLPGSRFVDDLGRRLWGALTAESEVAAERDRLASVVNSLAEGVLLLNVAGEVLFSNRAAAEMIDSDPDSLVGQEGFGLISLTDGVEPFSSARLMALIGAGGSLFDRDALLYTTAGGKLPIEVHIVGVANSGAAVVSFLDRRLELQQASRIADSEERFQLLFDHSPVATYELDFTEVGSYFDDLRTRGIDDLRAFAERNPGQVVEAADRIKVLNANRVGVELFERHDADAIRGSFNFKRLDAEDLQGFFALAHAAWKGLTSAKVELSLRGINDEPLHVIAAFEMRPKGGVVDLSRVILTLTDITDRKLEEQRVKDQISAKDEFLASVSHQLRTPLTHVMASAELLAENKGLTSDDIGEIIGMIVRGASEMRSFVEDLIASARTKDGILTVKPAVVDVGRVTDDVLEVVARVYERKTARNATAGVTAWADPLRLNQVLRNLIMNAFQYGGPQVEISGVRSHGRTIIEVRDDGIGVSPDLEIRIFDDYWGTGRAGDSGSLGIGLTVSKRLAEAMGGSLSYSRRGQTTVFTLELPAEGPAPE